MKKILVAALMWPLLVLAQSYPSPTFNNVTVNGTLTGKINSTGSTITNATITGGSISGISPPIPVASGGTNSATASGAALDNITGFASTGFMSRTGAGAYSFTGSTGSGNVVLATSPTIASPTVTGAFNATGLVTLADLATQAANTVLANATASSASPTAFAMPGCSAATNALTWTTSTGFTCNSAINAATLGGATFASPGAIGSTTPNTGAFTTLSASGTVSGAGFSNYLAAPPAIGSTTPNTGAFTTLAANSAATFSTTLKSLQYTGSYTTQVSQFGGRLLVTNNATDNSIVGAVVQDGSNGNSFPTGVTGYGLMTSGSNQAFGIYGQCDLGTNGGAALAGTCTNEFDTFNYSGAPSSQLPPDLSFTTTQKNAIPVQIATYGNYASSIGLNISYGTQPMLTGIYMHPQAITNYGLFIDATSSNGPSYGAILKTKVTGTPLQLQTMGSISNNSAVLNVVDNGSVSRASIRQIGDHYGRVWVSSGQSTPTIPTCTGVGTGGTCAIESGSNDGAGTILVTGGSSASAGGGTINLSFSTAVGTTSSACFLQPAGNWAANTSLFITSQSTTSVQFNYLNGGGTGTALSNGTVYRVNYFCTGH